MPFRKWSTAAKREAIALATSIGADLAAEQLGMTPDAIRDWAKKANVTLSDVIAAPDWERLMNLALARTEAMLASGNLKPAQVATVAAIARRNMDRKVAAPPESAVAARETFFDSLAESVDVTETTLPAMADSLDRLPGLFIRLANDEPGQPHRRAILAWFAGNAETEAADVLEWARSHIPASLLEWRDSEVAREARERVVRQRAAVLVSSGMRPFEADAMAREISGDLAA